MRGLTMTQPWATLVALGAKQYETRGWRTSYRGPLAIHAAKGWPKAAQAICVREPFYSVLDRGGYFRHEHEPPGGTLRVVQLPAGFVVAVVDVVACLQTGISGLFEPDWLAALSAQERAFGDYSPGRWAWRLENVRPIRHPIPARGYQFLWNVEPELLDEIHAQQGATPAGAHEDAPRIE
jgi:activating signal cointegrator 1